MLDALDLDALSARGERQRCCAGAAPLDLDTLAELVAIAPVAAVVAERVTSVPSSTRRPGGGRRATRSERWSRLGCQVGLTRRGVRSPPRQ